MKEIRYKSFSWNTHKKNWKIKKPNVCQFELTFCCGLHCKHCYTDCYNKPSYLKKELNTKETKIILDKVYQAGAIWLCFTGGDPLARRDFLDIYSYARNKGFIITVFTSGYSMTERIARYLKKEPPFVIEMTINAATKETYEKISQVKGSFKKVKEGISLILKGKLPLRIKTQITKDNLREIPEIKKFIEGLGLRFRPYYDLYARLNHNLAPCKLRISPQEVLSLDGKPEVECRDEYGNYQKLKAKRKKEKVSVRKPAGANLFYCVGGGGEGIYVDPYGNTFACNLIRKPAFNLLKVSVDYARDRLLSLVRNRKFVSDSKCNGCNLRENCRWCPGKAYVETGDEEAPVPYYCELAEVTYRSGKS